MSLRRRDARFQLGGFTLIELLIVVAIIAILAAIAVPNFLEAQARSKVSRAKADIRTIATAIESYSVDNNMYPRRSNTEQDHPQGTGTYTGFRDLTTPVAYLTSIPQDGFGRSESVPGVSRPACYAMGVGNAGTRAPNISGGKPDSYLLNSDGPDRMDQTNGLMADGAYPWPNLNRADPTVTFNYTSSGGGTPVVLSALTSVYDPTNGTVSSGEIMRFGGVKPEGAVYDYLYGASMH